MIPEVSYYKDLLFSGQKQSTNVHSIEDLHSLGPQTQLVVCHQYDIPGAEKSLPGMVLQKTTPSTIIFKSQNEVDRFNSEHHFKGAIYAVPYPVKIPQASARDPQGPVLYFAGTSVEHRAHKVLEALGQSKLSNKLVWMVSGKVEEARRILANSPIDNAELLEFSAVSDWQGLVEQGACFAIHTYFSAFGDPGPFLPISMANSLPVIVSDMGYGASLPDAVAIKVLPGAFEVRDLIEAISKARSSLTSEVYAQAARQFAAEHHCLESLRQEISLI